MASCDFFNQDIDQGSSLIQGPNGGKLLVWVNGSIRGNTTSGLTRPMSGMLFFEDRQFLQSGPIGVVIPARFSGTLSTETPFDELGVTISGPRFFPEEGLSIHLEVRMFGGVKLSTPRQISLSPVTCTASVDQPGAGTFQASGTALDGGPFGSYVIDISVLNHVDFGGFIFKAKAG